MYYIEDQKINIFFITHPYTPPAGGDLWNLFSDLQHLNKAKCFKL